MTAVRTFSALVILVGGIVGGRMTPICIGCGPGRARPMRRAADEPTCRCHRPPPTCCGKKHPVAGEGTKPCGNCLHLPPSENRATLSAAVEPDLSCRPAAVLADLAPEKPFDAASNDPLRAWPSRPPPAELCIRTTVLLI